MRRFNFLLVIILAIYFFTRFYQVSEIPASLYWDEASIGYNAYSILNTGHDEWGDTLPLHFRAFGEFKLPLYIYSVVLTEWLFGVSIFSVRLPSILAGAGVLILTYLITQKLIKDRIASLIACFTLVALPWFFIFSRIGYEATLGLFIFYLGFYLWLTWKESGVWRLLGMVVCFSLSMYTYNSYRLVVPLLLPILLMFDFKYLVKSISRKFLTLVILGVFILSLVPIIRFTINTGGGGRLQSVGILNKEDPYKTTIEFTKNYLSHFNPQFLFISGDSNSRSALQSFGEIYFWMVPFLLLGLIVVLVNKQHRTLLIIFLISFLPAAITKEAPHALRTLTATPILGVLTGIGFFHFRYSELPKVEIIINKLKILLLYLLILGFLIYFNLYITNYNSLSSSHFQYSYKVLNERFRDRFDKYSKVYISDAYGQPYIFSLFYLNYDVDQFIKTVKYNSPDRWGDSTVGSFGNFIFTRIDQVEKFPKNTLIVASEFDRPSDGRLISIIYDLDNRPSLYLYENN